MIMCPAPKTSAARTIENCENTKPAIPATKLTYPKYLIASMILSLDVRIKSPYISIKSAGISGISEF